MGFSVLAEPIGGVDLQVTDRGSTGLTVRFDLSAISYDVNWPGFTPLDMTFSDSREEIPVFSRLISVPIGHKAVIKSLRRESIHLWSQNVTFDEEPTPISAHQIAEFSLDPPVAVDFGKGVIWRGRPVTPLKIYPVQIVSDNESVIENRVLEFEIVFEPDPLAKYITPINDLPGNELGRMIDNIILNHDSDGCVGEQQAHRGRMLMLVQEYPREGNDTEFLERAVPWIDSLATWKRNMGYSVEIVTVNHLEISSSEIKNEIIRPRYEDQSDPLTYLFLIGGADPEGQIYFPSFRPPQGEEGDHFYSFFGENQYLADIAVGRMEVTSFRQLRGAVKRTINYERDPWVEADEFDENGGEWFDRALFTAENIAAPGGQFVPSMIHLGRWVVNKLDRYGYDTIDTLWAANVDDNINPDVKDILENGVSLAISRGWLGGCYYREGNEGEYETPDNGRKYPFVMAVTCLSYETIEGFFQSVSASGNDGPIASIAMKGLSHTTPNNSLLGGSVRGLTQFGLHQAGIIQMFGKYQMWSDQRHDLGELALANVVVFRLMGDPTTQIYTDMPTNLEANFPEQISLGATGLSIQVANDGEIVPDAWVSVYQTDGIHLVCQPCEDGWARFTFAQEELMEGDIGITITRPNALPFHGSVEVASAGNRIDLTNIQFDNEDELFANGESIPTTLTFTNNGQNDFENIVVSLSADDEHISFSEEQIQIDELPAGEDGQIEFSLAIDRASQYGRSVRIQAVVSSGDASWEAAFSFMTSGHKLTMIGSADPNNEFRSDSQTRLIPRLMNRGDLHSPDMKATLTSLSPYVNVTVDSVYYGDISAFGEIAVPEDNRSFRVSVDELAINGSIAKFLMTLEARDENDGFADHIYFEEVIGEADMNDPFGPDEYGYIMFDSEDEDWSKAPAYNWIEINPNKNEGSIMGNLLDLDDFDVDFDSTIAVELPFTFQFYGSNFDTIAVNSNGWIAFGADKTQFLDFRNQQIPGIQGPDAMVAILWQDLINYLESEQAGVYTYYDEVASIFIVEWSAIRVYQDLGESIEVQIILYDADVYPTSSGDGEIKLQYKTATHAGGDHTDNQFSTVGIKNLDGTDGLEYVYWDQYPAANKPLEDGMAILITTDRFSTFGSIEGSITREEDHEAGIEGAVVKALRSGIDTVTDENGNYAFESILTGRERIRVTKAGFNELIITLDVIENETSIDTSRLTHPQIAVPDDQIVKGLHSGNYGVTFDFSFENLGNGPLTYDFSTRYLDGSATEYAETWKANLSGLANNDRFLMGCQFVEDEIFVAGRAVRDDFEDERIYVFSRDENNNPTLVRSFLQPNQTENGFSDLAYDGRYLYGGEALSIDTAWTQVVVKFNQEGDVLANIILDVDSLDLDLPYALAYNPRDSTLISTKDDKDIFVFNQDGELVDRIKISVPGDPLVIQGLAWNDNDDDDMPLYIVDQPDIGGGIRLSKANLETGKTMIIGELEGYIRDLPTGLTIGFEWEESTLNLATIAGGVGNRNNDTLRIYEIGPDNHYLKINPKHGTVGSGQTAIISMEMRSTGLPDGDYSHRLAISHNANEEEVIILATLRINDVYEVPDGKDQIPTQFRLEQAFPNPFNNTTHIDFSLTTDAYTKLTVYDIAGRQVALLVNEELTAGNHSALFNPAIQASGIYIYRLKSNGKTAVKRMVYLK